MNSSPENWLIYVTDRHWLRNDHRRLLGAVRAPDRESALSYARRRWEETRRHQLSVEQIPLVDVAVSPFQQNAMQGLNYSSLGALLRSVGPSGVDQ